MIRDWTLIHSFHLNTTVLPLAGADMGTYYDLQNLQLEEEPNDEMHHKPESCYKTSAEV